MKLGKAAYRLEYQAILFVAIDSDEPFVCYVTPEQLDPDDWFSLKEPKMLELFWKREKEIIKAAAATIEEARQRGIKHEPGKLSKPLPIVLSY